MSPASSPGRGLHRLKNLGGDPKHGPGTGPFAKLRNRRDILKARLVGPYPHREITDDEEESGDSSADEEMPNSYGDEEDKDWDAWNQQDFAGSNWRPDDADDLAVGEEGDEDGEAAESMQVTVGSVSEAPREDVASPAVRQEELTAEDILERDAKKGRQNPGETPGAPAIQGRDFKDGQVIHTAVGGDRSYHPCEGGYKPISFIRPPPCSKNLGKDYWAEQVRVMNVGIDTKETEMEAGPDGRTPMRRVIRDLGYHLFFNHIIRLIHFFKEHVISPDDLSMPRLLGIAHKTLIAVMACIHLHGFNLRIAAVIIHIACLCMYIGECCINVQSLARQSSLLHTETEGCCTARCMY